MRTISKNLKMRLLAQAEEASFRGMEKTAAMVSQQALGNPVRQNEEEYIYSRASLQNDVENLLWSAAVRTQDYFGKTADAVAVGELIESLAEELISSVRTKIGGDIVGPNEPIIEGEQRIIIEIDED